MRITTVRLPGVVDYTTHADGPIIEAHTGVVGRGGTIFLHVLSQNHEWTVTLTGDDLAILRERLAIADLLTD